MDEEIDEIRELATPLEGTPDLDPLLARIGNARYVLIGEASHGTADYYTWRAELSKRLIEEKGFDFVAVEGDWPDCFTVNRWVKGHEDQDRSARAVLGEFDRWPTWMWANDEVAAFIDWLRDHNLRAAACVGFYGLDVYSLWESLREILRYVDDHIPEARRATLAAWDCFEPYGEDPQAYAWANRLAPPVCESAVVDMLVELRRSAPAALDDPEAELDAIQNAEVVADAERYYRTMIQADGESWNIRDCHMVDTLDRLVTYHGRGSKAIVWEHNTHVGDARATDMAAHGMVNVGQVVRERHGTDDVVLVGFAGHRGTVIAADHWGAPATRFPVPEAHVGTHEELLHAAVGQDSTFVFPDDRRTPWLTSRRGHRAIGVVYDPRRERRGNWVPTVMGGRYDALISLEATDALHPLLPAAVRPSGEMETFPWGG